MALILDGKALAERIRAEVTEEVRLLKADGIQPRLAVALVGEHPPSVIYVRNKENACQAAGIVTTTARLPATTTEGELLRLIDDWNTDGSIHAILIQLPLPAHMNQDEAITRILPQKDVDGLHPVNLGRLISGEPYFYPATPLGILEILRYYGIIIAGRHVVVVGRGTLVGKPLANMLLKKNGANATVTVCHSATPELERFTRQADILVVAAGRPKLICADMVKQGVVVVDAGTNRVSENERVRLVGDVDFAGVEPVATAITPVPGGVGPMTIAMLLRNTVKAAKNTQSN